MRVVVIAGRTRSLPYHRGPLLRELVARGHEVVAVGPPDHADVEKALTDMGIDFRPIAIERTAANGLRDAKTFSNLVLLIRKLQPQAVLSYNIKPVIYGSLAAAFARTRHIVSIITGLGTVFMDDRSCPESVRWIAKRLYRLALSRNQAVFFENPDDARLFAERGFLGRSTRVQVVDGCGIDLDHFPPVLALPRTTTFLFMGRLLRQKGIDEFIAASRAIKTLYPHVRCQILGRYDTNPSSLQESDIRALASEGLIEYLGEAQDVRPHLGSCSVLVLPSYREGTPRSALEAMATGRPVITTDAPGCRETVQDGRTGYLVAPRSVGGLVHAMRRFVENPELVGDFGREGLAYVRRRYDVHRVNRPILDEIESASSMWSPN